MADVRVTLHDAQMEIFQSPARFKVASCGRRFGKSYLAAWILMIKALQQPQEGGKDVFYIAPTFQQAKDIMWAILKEIGKDVIKSTHENTATVTGVYVPKSMPGIKSARYVNAAPPTAIAKPLRTFL